MFCVLQHNECDVFRNPKEHNFSPLWYDDPAPGVSIIDGRSDYGLRAQAMRTASRGGSFPWLPRCSRVDRVGGRRGDKKKKKGAAAEA